jgi:hypothetical protein
VEKRESSVNTQDVIDIVQKMSNMQLEVLLSNKSKDENTVKLLKDIQEENIKALNTITTFIHNMSDATLRTFKDIATVLNQRPDEQLDVQQEIEKHITSIDEEIYNNKENHVYILIPGSENNTVTYDEAIELLKNKTIHVYGSVRSMAVKHDEHDEHVEHKEHDEHDEQTEQLYKLD